MYLGKLVEFAETEKMFAKPMHPYTEALLSAVPDGRTVACHREKELDLGGFSYDE